MRKFFRTLFNSGQQGGEAKALPAPTLSVKVEGAVLSEVLDPGKPYHEGEPVPRWPEHGAAIIAATPEQLLETQAATIKRIREFCPLRAGEFDQLLMPAFLRYISWVHLLPASESHHHYGPGGLLAHGFEAAMHAARIADGKPVGTELTPTGRIQYRPRWKVAAMLGALCHDLGKPLADCGATDTARTMTWPPHAGSLYAWLQANQISHYRIYWRSGPRHERHKPLGTSIIREILGPELLAWLSDEPTQDVVNLMMVSIANGKIANNLMSVVISLADGLSVEADLKRLVERTRATGQGGGQSAAALVAAEIKRLLETNSISINRPGAALWVTTVGVFGLYPAFIEQLMGGLVRKNISGLPANPLDIADLLISTGFAEASPNEEVGGKATSPTWDLSVDMVDAKSGQVLARPALRALKFASWEAIAGALPQPTPQAATVTSPHMTEARKAEIAAAVGVVSAPQSLASATGGAAPAAAGAEAASAAATAAESAANQNVTQPAVAVVPSAIASSCSQCPAPVGGVAEPANQPATAAGAGEPQGGHGCPDIAQEPIPVAAGDAASVRAVESTVGGLAEAIDRLEQAGDGGIIAMEVLRRVASGQVAWGKQAFMTHDGLAVEFPAAVNEIGMSIMDALTAMCKHRWVVIDTGSDRKVSDRVFPDGENRRCLVFTGLVARTWEAIASAHPEIYTGARVQLPGDEQVVEPAAAPRPEQRQGTGNGNRGRSAGGSPMAEHAEARAREPQSERGGRMQQPAQAARPSTGPAPGPGRGQVEAEQSGRSAVTSGANRAERAQQPRPAAGQPASPVAPRPAQQASAPQAHRIPAECDSSPAAEHTPTHPRGKEDLRCTKLSELTPLKIEWINGAAYIAYSRMIMKTNDEAAAQASVTLRHLMKSLAQSNEIRMAPFVTAMATTDNPIFLFKKPISLNLEDVGDVKLNPAYAPPQWAANTLDRILERARQQ